MGFFTGMDFSSAVEQQKRKNSSNEDPAGQILNDYGPEDEELDETLMKSLEDIISPDNPEDFEEDDFEDMDDDDDEDDENEDDNDEDEDKADDENEEDMETADADLEDSVMSHTTETEVRTESPVKAFCSEPVMPSPAIPSSEQEDLSEKEETLTTVGKSCVISGDIDAKGNIVIYGRVEGNVSGQGQVVIDTDAFIGGSVHCPGKIMVKGTVSGGVQGGNICADHARIQGNVCSEQETILHPGTVVIGDIFASSLTISGAVKGNIDVKGDVLLHKDAVVKGDIRSASIGMEPGSVIDGACRQIYSSVNLDEIFGKEESGRIAK